MTRLSLVLGVLGASCALAASPARAGQIITFESAPDGPFASYTESGVTFTASGGGGAILGTTTPNGTRGLLDNNTPRRELRADIAGGATSVSVDLGDFNSDPDTIFLEAFDSSDNSLGFTSQVLDASFTGMVTLSISASNIAYAVFGARDPALNGSSAYADNFTFETAVSAVPEPSTLISGGLAGIAGLGLAWRRRRTAVAA